ncbi:3-ketoacyl-CoA synthase [Striga asiatica]|uniref:3-ketoacyl-CoA synthase n=1 Tax=Striga asiatica TaxID=4170 RepID=A0A5A7REQ5_STRAF|nr:3-ketoacyl-CoA synthase [Striga asiatica]
MKELLARIQRIIALITFLFSSFPVNLRLSPPAAAALLLLLLLLVFLLRRRRPVFLFNYSCYKPPPHRRCSFQAAESFLRRQSAFPPAAIEFMRGIYVKSGLGDRTYAPPFIFEPGCAPTLKHASQEAEEGISAAVDALLSKTRMDPLEIDAVVVACGSFSPSPSLSSLIVNRYKLRPDVKTYDLSGMGCSSGAIAVDTAARVVRAGRKARVALVVVTESITLNWYGGESRPMLVSNCIFRVGCAAAIVSSHVEHRGAAKMELVESVRTHHGWDDSAYRAAYQEEDSEGRTGISLTKDLIRVAGVHLRQHIRVLAPRVLPLSVLAQYAYSKRADFSRAFEHMCIHTGGKAVIENVGRVLGLGEEVTEPARMSLNRFGNTSSSLVFYELAYFEAKKRAKKGDRMWMLAFGTGFKVGSLVWKWLADSTLESDNPWMDCVDDYPLKAW